MSFGIYIHIPYCIQRCTYCDFATYEQSRIMPPEQYVDLVKQEIRSRHSGLPKGVLNTIYFGGGTPSLIPAHHIVSILEELAKHGFYRGPETEITLEINPATLDQKKMEIYLKAGINRFSVGAQTFNDSHLKAVHREHTSQQTRETLSFLKSFGVNYSFDILFALPFQSLDEVRKDLEEVLFFQPPHVSPYCLTVPEDHILSKNRPLEEDQLKMFDIISSALEQSGYQRYEISNFAQPGFESKHNSLYWDDEPYWGLGLSSHSYLKSGDWGTRFWNERSLPDYEARLKKEALIKATFDSPFMGLPFENVEILKLHQALTDFCHTSLRRRKGLVLSELKNKFGAKISQKIQMSLHTLIDQGHLTLYAEDAYRLTDSGILVSNQVFSALTFLETETVALKS